MPVTILEIAEELGVESKDGQVNGGEIMKYGLPLMGGCEICHASIACYNAYPTQSGYLRCGDCVHDTGWDDMDEAIAFVFGGRTPDEIIAEANG